MANIASFLHDWSVSQGGALGFVECLSEECPWLDGESELDSEIGAELLAEHFGRWGLQERVPAFVEAYNEFVYASSGVRHPTREEAYSTMCQVLAKYGENSAYGEGDFWLVEDSFSTEKPCVVVFDATFRFSEAVLEQLGSAAALCPFFQEVVIGDEEGTVLQVKAVQRNGG